tara:strand:+ start:696 stop:1595 length:900 start_codon:yes stop_codon:yes gene_type:complete
MADASGQADIRGIDIDKLAKGFADEATIFKTFVTQSTTSAREMRWFQKTSGYLDSVDTTGITASKIVNVPERALPTVVEQSWSRKTSYVKKFFVESPTISAEDIKDSDIDILATNVRDLVRAVGRQVDIRIYDVITDNVSGTIFDGSDVTSAAATADGWNDNVTGDPIKDIMLAITTIRNQSYDTTGLVMILHPDDHSSLLEFLISVKGSSIPQFASEKVKSGVVMTILGVQVVVSANATTDNAIVFVPNRVATWKSFMPMTSVVIDDPGIGKKIRVWEEGECLLTDPNAAAGITDLAV